MVELFLRKALPPSTQLLIGAILADWLSSTHIALLRTLVQVNYIVCYKVENNVVYIQESNYNHRNYPNHTVSEWINTSNGNRFGSIALIK